MSNYGAVLRGVSWVGAFRASTRGVAIVRIVILARILTPAQFGVFGIASLVVAFLEILMETGINVVLIQKKGEFAKYIDTAWVVSIFRGIIISLILVGVAPLVSTFFNSPGARDLIYLVSLVPLIRGFINPAIVRFQKELRFGAEFWFRLAVFLFDSAVAILVSLITRSAAGLVWGLIAGAALELVLSFIFVRPWPKFGFRVSQVKDILSKGKWVTGAGVFQFLFKQGDDGVVGRLLGEGPLGIYQVAYKISSLPVSEVGDVFARVMFPVYTKLSNEPERLKNAFLKTTVSLSVLSLTMGLFLFALGGEIIRIFLGEDWLSAVPLVRVLSIFGVVSAIGNSVNSLFLAVEKQKYVTIITFIAVLGLGVSIVPLTLRYGLNGAVWAPLVGSLVSLPVAFWLLFGVFQKK